MSSCGERCLRDGARRVSGPRYWARLGSASLLLGVFLLVRPVVARRPAAMKAFARALLASLGVRLVVRGKPRPGLLVANHVSWVDVVLMMALDGQVRLVAKREVGDWPVIGPVAGALGAIFVDRSAPRRLPGTVAQVTRELKRGATVAVFPEATTTCGTCRVPMRPAFFQAAVDAGAPVTPISLSFRVNGESSPAAAFVGKEALLDSVRRMARTRGLTLTVTVGRAIFSEPWTDRRALARLAEVYLGRVQRSTPKAMPRDAAAATPSTRHTRDVSRLPLVWSGAPDYHAT